jgi:dTDP-4-dehydrorhamnose reductase
MPRTAVEVTCQARYGGHRVVATFNQHRPVVADVAWRSLDIRNRDDVTDLVVAVRPDVVVNAAYRQSD